jgi:hypothetical protein
VKLSRPIKTPTGPQQEFTLPAEATLALFRGVHLPIQIDERKRVIINLEAEAVTLFISNLLELPPSFVNAIPLSEVSEILVASLPLLPPALRDLILNGNAPPVI